MTEMPQAPNPRPPLRRSTDDRMIAGVCGGLARTLGVDPVVVRVMVAVLCLLGGTGVAAYIIAWILLPDDSGENVLQRRAEGRSRAPQLLLVIVLAAAAVSMLRHATTGVGDGLGFLLFVIIAVVAWQAFGSDWSRRTSVTHDATTPGPSVSVDKGADGQTVTVQTPAGTTVIRQEPRSVLGRIVWNLLVVAFGVMLGLNLTGTADIAGRTVVAVLLGIVAAGLLVSAFVGRARGLIALGLVLTLLSFPLGWASSAEVGDRTWRPTAVELTDAYPNETTELVYELGAGNAVLDLTALGNSVPDSVDTTIQVRIAAGDLQVIMPDDGTLRVDGHVQIGVGQVQALDAPMRDGTGVTQDFVVEGTGGHITLDIALGVGNVAVHHEVETTHA